MFKSIEDILNFRYNPARFSSWKYESVSKKDFNTLNNKPLAYNFFQTILHPEVSIIDNFASTIFCHPNEIAKLTHLLKSTPSLRNSARTLVIAGEDTKLSTNQNKLNKIKPFFSNIFYEAKDIESNEIKTIPMGVNLAYLLRCGGTPILDIFNNNQLSNKKHLVGTAFGSKWPEITNLIPDRKNLLQSVESKPFIKNFHCKPVEFISKLSEYFFFCSPLGIGEQTPKICESILCETVPILTSSPTSHELKNRYNLPIIIVDSWKSISEKELRRFIKEDYSQIDWAKAKSVFHTKNLKKIISGNFC